MSEKNLSTGSPDTQRLAKWLTGGEGRSFTEAMTEALRERLDRFEGRPNRAGTRAAVARIQEMLATRPEMDHRSSEEILGYDEVGLPT
jgi:antitoxin VapB